MAKRTKDPWPSRRRRAVQLAERLVTTTASSLPVDLNRIAGHCAVRRIEFMPLLTDGGLAVLNDGFVIYVRCDAGQSADLTARFADDGTGSTLPEKILRRARFTIAHEIAHTLFYDIHSAPPRLKTRVDDTTNLEIACNQIAGLLVMPEALIQQALAKCEFIRPEQLRKLADVAMVSTETVVRRFRHLRRFIHPEAILVSTYKKDNDWVINAISRHDALRSIFTGARVGAAIKALVHDADFALFGGEMREAEIEYFGHGGKRTKMRFTCEVGTTLRRNRPVFVVGTPVPE
jgi:IrrE N-terminal-like domain